MADALIWHDNIHPAQSQAFVRMLSPKVELMGRYSKIPKHPRLSLNSTTELRQLPHIPQRVIRPIARRLSLEAIQQLIADYQAGAPGTQLAETYGLSKYSVMKLLRSYGIPIRNQGLTDNEINEAVGLYGQGWSCQRIGDRFRRRPSVIYNALKRAGVRLRGPHDR